MELARGTSRGRAFLSRLGVLVVARYGKDCIQFVKRTYFTHLCTFSREKYSYRPVNVDMHTSLQKVTQTSGVSICTDMYAHIRAHC